MKEDLLRSRRGNKSTYITSQKEIKGRVAISLAVFFFVMVYFDIIALQKSKMKMIEIDK